MTPAPIALVAACLGGLVTALALVLGVLNLVAGTTRPDMLSLAGSVVVLPAGLVALAAGFYVGRRVWATLRPPADSPAEPPPETEDGAP